MNEYLKCAAENVDIKHWPSNALYISVAHLNSTNPVFRFNNMIPNYMLTKPDHWFTKEEVIKAQQDLKQQKDWVSFEESGVPPVGTMLMNFAGEKREVVLVCDDHVVCRTFEGETRYKAYHFNHWDSYNLKPWKAKTDEDIAVEAMIEFASEHDMAITPYVKKFMQTLYKEIKSGKIKI